ncbi:MAG: CHASE2 domain-containing protein [Candidatus Riflebacteria bacterium]|nr:CHASE2 domain-containing protein [Candidatus Riflebacteria bacterium]
MPPSDTFRVRVIRAFSEMRSGLAIGFLATCLTTLLMLIGATEGIEDYLRALVIQAQDVKPPGEQPILIIRKDEETGFFVNRNPARRELASVIRLLGRSRRAQYPGERSRLLKLVDLRFGFFPPSNKATLVVPWIGLTPSKQASAGIFFTFTENLSRCADFMQFEFETVASGSSVTNVSWPALLPQFFENIHYMKLGFDIRLFPREGTFLSLAPTLSIELPADYPVDAARIISIDVILQGARLKEEDDLLAAAIHDSESPIILAGQCQSYSRERTQAMDALKKLSRIATSSVETDELKIIRPYEQLLQGSAMTGFVDARYSKNRYVTSLPLFQEVDKNGRLEPSYCLLTAVQALDRVGRPGLFLQAMRSQLDQIAELRRKGVYEGGFQLVDRFIPTDTNGQMEVTFFGSGQKDSSGRSVLPSFSMSECFDDDELAYLTRTLPEWADRYKPELVHQNSMNPIHNYGNRICMLGSFEQSDADFFETPLTLSTPFSSYNRQLSGVEINANAVLTILDKRFIRSATPICSIGLTLICALLLGKSLEFAAVFLGGALTLAIMIGAAWLAVFSLHKYGVMMHLSLLFLTMALTWVGSTLSHYWRQRRQAATTQAMFQKFVSADVVTAMIKNPDLVKPGGQKVILTVFFSDLAGFSTISELLSAEDLVLLLNEYLGTMTQVLFKHGGTLDKFIGDAVMAFWNFPVAQQDHAARACLCAIAMQEKINELQVDWSRRGFPKVSARIGLNTAEVIVGYMGAEDAQMNFTCMGDGVNLASRLEGANKQYGTLLMASEATYLLARESVTGRFLDLLTVKGKHEPVKVYELVSRKGAEPPDWAEHAAIYERGLGLYQGRNWTQAEEAFMDVLTRWPEDGAARTYLNRCMEFQATPPGTDWDGVYRLTHK